MVVFSPPLPDHAQVGDPGHISDHNALLEAVKALNTGKIDLSIFTAKGSLVLGTGLFTLNTLAIGSDNQTLVSDSTQVTGARWALIGTQNLSDYSVTRAKLADNAATTVATTAPSNPKVGAVWVDPSVSVDTLVLPLGTSSLADGAVTTAKIADSSVNAAKIADGSVGTTELAAGAVTSEKIANGTVTGTDIATDTITVENLANNSVDTVALQDQSVTSAKIADGTIATGDIADQAVTAAKIANDTITATQIATNAVGSSELADNAVDTNAIADGAVTDAKLAGDSVTTAKIAANSVTTAKIADSAVTTGKIANSSVDAAKIVDGSVGTSEIADAAVTAAKLSAGLGGLLTTKGDLVARDASTAVRLPVGTDGQVLVADAAASAGVKWGAEPAVKATVGNLLTDNQAGGYSGWGSDGTVDYWGGGDFAITSAWSYVFTSTRYAVTAGDTVTIQAELQPVGAGAYVVTQFFTALEGGDAVGGERYGNTVPNGGNALSRLTTVVPATATAMTFLIYGGTSALHVRHPGIWKGAGGVWALPGTPIVGQSRIAVNNAVDLSGTGTPEGVVTAAPGSTWLQTDSTTDVKGWIKWIKASGIWNTGWQAGAEADTGWRETTTWDTAGTVTGIALEANAVPKAGTAGWIRMRRVGDQVFIALSGLDVGTGTVAIYGTGVMPAGFKTQSPANNPVFPISNGTVTGAIGAPVSATGLGLSQPSGQMFVVTSPVVASAVTSDTWPTSLPGVAV